MNSRYRQEELIGKGGAGAVYRGFDTQLERVVAIKRLLVHTGEVAHDAGSQGSAESLINEAKTLSRFRHPNIVTVYDAGVDEQGYPFVVMEYIEGEDLESIIARQVFAEEDFIQLASESLEALVAAHARGLLHRDLKPGNLMLEAVSPESFRVKLLDFGLAKISQSPVSQTIDQDGSVLGSIYYMAPEQFERKPLDQRTDLYQLGCVLHYALTARHPFDGESGAEVMSAHLNHQIHSLAELRPDLSPLTVSWVDWLTARDPEDRPSTAEEALRHLQGPPAQLATTRTVPRSTAPQRPVLRAPAPAPSRDGSHLPWILGGGFVLIAAGVAGFLLWNGTLRPPGKSEEIATASPPRLETSSALSGQPSAPAPSPAQASSPAAVPETEDGPAPTPAPPEPAPAPVPDPDGSDYDPRAEAARSPFDLDFFASAIGKRVVVEGEIVRAGESRSGKTRYLNFDRRPGTSISLAFRTEDVGQIFPMSRLDGEFVGRTLRVSGEVTEVYGDLLIFVEDESQITKLPR